MEPRYLETWRSGALAPKVERALECLRDCRLCPRDCGVDRLADNYSFCLSGRYAVVSSAFPHFGEENCLRGRRGSGTIFFGHCNLRCVFCQNFEISQRAPRKAKGTPPDELAAMMLGLQARGCHNINFVTPEHVVPQVIEALPIAIEGGLRVPLVYNTSAYDSMESLELLDGLVDIYMPDFKYWDRDKAKRYLKAEDYPEVARHSIAEMHRQVGDLVLDEAGLAVSGLLVRHLVMPDALEDTQKIAAWLAAEVSPDTYINVMGQYYPEGRVSADRYPELNRRLRVGELVDARRLVSAAGLSRMDTR